MPEQAQNDELVENFIQTVEAGLADLEEGQPLMIVCPPETALRLIMVMRRSKVVPYLAGDMVALCKGEREVLLQGAALQRDFPQSFDRASLVGRIITWSVGLAQLAKTAVAAATERHAVLEHIARNLWEALDTELGENASAAAIRARAALADLSDDDETDIRTGLSRRLCLPFTGGDKPDEHSLN